MEKRTFICEQKDGSFIYASRSQIEDALKIEKEVLSIEKKIKDLQKKKKKLTENCKHEVTWDEPGMPYNIRHCVKCGHTSLL